MNPRFPVSFRIMCLLLRAYLVDGFLSWLPRFAEYSPVLHTNSSKLGYFKKNMTSEVPVVVKGLTTLVINISVKGQEAAEELMLPLPT